LTTRCLAIGGSDSSAGAGIQADLAAFQRQGIHACCAITALTAQTPRQVYRIQASPIAQLQAELDAAFSWQTIAAIKTGMLAAKEQLECVQQSLIKKAKHIPLIIDPVLVSSSGQLLLEQQALHLFSTQFLPLASLITPNRPEAAQLLGRSIQNPIEDCKALAQRFNTAILLKGGHSSGAIVLDILCESNGKISCFKHQRQSLSEQQAHGTGCRLAASITAYIAKQQDLPSACQSAIHDLWGSLS